MPSKKELLSKLNKGVLLQNENALKKSLGAHLGIWDGVRLDSVLSDFERIAESLYRSGYRSGLKDGDPKEEGDSILLKDSSMTLYVLSRVFRHFVCNMNIDEVFELIEENFKPQELDIMNSLAGDMSPLEISKVLKVSENAVQKRIEGLEYSIRAFFYANNDIVPEEAFFDNVVLNIDEDMQNFMDRLLFGEKKDKSISLEKLSLILEDEVAKGSPLVIDEEISRRDLFILNRLSRGESYSQLASAFGVEGDAIADRFTTLVHKLKHPKLIQPAIVY